MTREQHSPGPWRQVSVAGGWDGVAPVGSKLEICQLVENNPANARLIAAAPELLAACQSAERALVELWPSESVPDEHIDETAAVHRLAASLRAAIAKAVGQ